MEENVDRITALLKRLETTPNVVRLGSFKPEILGDCTVGDLRKALESVREEALKDAQKACLELEIFYDNAITDSSDFRLLEGKRESAKRCAEAIGALQGIMEKVERYYREVALESPAKEQPVEVAELVRLLKARADGDLQHPAELLCRNAAALIEKLGHGWIPVSERLPEDGVEVDIWMHIYASPRSFGMDDDFRVVEAWRRGTDWFHRHEGKEKALYTDYITHWMPLPPPPERP